MSDQETREGWWEELRDEIKNHAKILCCTHIVGYSETCTVYGEICVLTAVGTAGRLGRLGGLVGQGSLVGLGKLKGKVGKVGWDFYNRCICS